MIKLSTKNWELDNIEAIIFDKDGTIVSQDLYWGEVVVKRVEAVLEFYNLDKTLRDELILALGFDETSKKLTQNAPIAIYPREDVIKFLMDRLKQISPSRSHFEPFRVKQSLTSTGLLRRKTPRNDFHFQDLDEIFTKVHGTIDPKDFIEPIEACLGLIEKLKKLPVRLILITSDGYKNTLKTLDKLEIMDDFELIMGRENCDEPKETGKIVKEALEILGLNPNNTIAIGDTKCDFDMAKNSNLKTCILVSTGQVPIEELQAYSNNCVHSLSEIVTKT